MIINIEQRKIEIELVWKISNLERTLTTTDTLQCRLISFLKKIPEKPNWQEVKSRLFTVEVVDWIQDFQEQIQFVVWATIWIWNICRPPIPKQH